MVLFIFALVSHDLHIYFIYNPINLSPASIPMPEYWWCVNECKDKAKLNLSGTEIGQVSLVAFNR
jgi:hypothetical protein